MTHPLVNVVKWQWFSTVLVVVDVANKMVQERVDPQIIRILNQNQQLPSILVLNKICVSVCVCVSIHVKLLYNMLVLHVKFIYSI